MLPFSSVEYFIISITFVIWMYCAKYFLSSIISYSTALLITTIIFLTFYYPKPIHILLFILYSYSAYFIVQKTNIIKKRAIASLIIILPMILVKVFEYSYTYHSISSIIFFPGLSYVSFRLISLFLDSDYNDPPINFVSAVNFLLFTPTLLIGPIDKYSRFNKDIISGYSNLKLINIRKGLNILKRGIIYKFVCAELINRYLLNINDFNCPTIFVVLIDMYAYYLYLFFDFAGYSSMAIGTGKMMGITVPENFIKPFLARNPKQFWQSFHKTLGAWLKDYFFMPFYKYFKSTNLLRKLPLTCQNISLFITFFLMGCWNGLAIHFIISGALFGIYSVIHNTYGYLCKVKGYDIIFGRLPDFYTRILSSFIMFNIVAFSIHIFSGRAPYVAKSSGILPMISRLMFE